MRNQHKKNGEGYMKLLSQNSKLKKTSKDSGHRVYNFGISTNSCIFARSCKAYCYAKSGAYLWPNVQPAFKNRLMATKSDSFIESMTTEISRSRCTHLRIHDSGDFYSREYIQKWFKIIESFPEIIFYAYTKSFILFKREKLPENFVLILSLGGENDHLINTKIHRHAKIFSSEKELKKAGYVNASKNDLLAIGKNYKIGLVAH